MTEAASKPTPMIAPVQFLGIQPGFDNEPAIELYILLSPVGHHPIGSTVSRGTLERHGYSLLTDPVVCSGRSDHRHGAGHSE